MCNKGGTFLHNRNSPKQKPLNALKSGNVLSCLTVCTEPMVQACMCVCTGKPQYHVL